MGFALTRKYPHSGYDSKPFFLKSQVSEGQPCIPSSDRLSLPLLCSTNITIILLLGIRQTAMGDKCVHAAQKKGCRWPAALFLFATIWPESY
jgi:hypothetical protein